MNRIRASHYHIRWSGKATTAIQWRTWSAMRFATGSSWLRSSFFGSVVVSSVMVCSSTTIPKCSHWYLREMAGNGFNYGAGIGKSISEATDHRTKVTGCF